MNVLRSRAVDPGLCIARRWRFFVTAKAALILKCNRDPSRFQLKTHPLPQVVLTSMRTHIVPAKYISCLTYRGQ